MKPFDCRFCVKCAGVEGEYLGELNAKRDPRVRR